MQAAQPQPPNKPGGARLLPALGLGLLFSYGLFALLFFVIHGKGHGGSKQETLQTIDFVRLKEDTQVETIERRKPPPPPPPKQPPPPPKLAVATDTPQQSVLPFNAPNLGLNASGVGGGPFVGSFTGGGGGGSVGLFDGDIIPLSRVPPSFPRKAAQDGIEGWVKLEIIVNADGTVKSAKVLEAKPRGIFDAAAVQAVQRWKFKPKVVDGRPAEQRGTQTVEFKLGEE